MRVKLQVAGAEDIGDLVSLQNSASQQLTAQFGLGPWSTRIGEKSILYTMTRAVIYVAKYRKQLVATLTLSVRKPWAIDKKYFTASKHALYLTSMVVSPDQQRKGIGRQCLAEAQRIAKLWPADAIRLDAWDSNAGAGEFYRKCGFRQVAYACYRTVPLIYFEILL